MAAGRKVRICNYGPKRRTCRGKAVSDEDGGCQAKTLFSLGRRGAAQSQLKGAKSDRRQRINFCLGALTHVNVLVYPNRSKRKRKRSIPKKWGRRALANTN